MPVDDDVAIPSGSSLWCFINETHETYHPWMARCLGAFREGSPGESSGPIQTPVPRWSYLSMRSERKLTIKAISGHVLYFSESCLLRKRKKGNDPRSAPPKPVPAQWRLNCSCLEGCGIRACLQILDVRPSTCSYIVEHTNPEVFYQLIVYGIHCIHDGPRTWERISLCLYCT